MPQYPNKARTNTGRTVTVSRETTAICKRGSDFIINYEPFWKTLKSRDISQYQLIKDYHFSTGTLDSLRKNKSITLNTLYDICALLDCEITDVVEFKHERKKG